MTRTYTKNDVIDLIETQDRVVTQNGSEGNAYILEVYQNQEMIVFDGKIKIEKDAWDELLDTFEDHPNIKR